MKMTKSLYVIIIFIALIVFSGCSKKELNYTVSEVDGIKTYFNKNIPSDPNFKISPKELFTIDFSENNPDSSLRYINFGNLCADKEKNIYLVDYMKCKVTKVDSLGKFVTSFGKKGTGPGEMNEPYNIAVMSDTLYVFDYTERKTNIFDLDGNFIKADFIASNAFFYHISGVNDEKFTGILALDRYGDQGVYTVYQIPIYTKNSLPYKELYNREEILQPPNDRFWPANYQPPYAVGKDKIYVMENSTDKYSILVFNFNGELQYKIRKNYMRLKVTDLDIEDTYLGKTDYKNINTYKNAANVFGLHATKDGYLLVQASIERTPENRFDYIVDAFKDGVYINSFKMEIGKAFDIVYTGHNRWFIGDRIYYKNRDDNYLSVYEY
ncbi:TPA: hypothetical protein DCR49_05395 [Candidatus Delongbacteria bacterium]|nr:hypothetical protein [Candidatus Delongbacteria bacterium]